MKNSVMEATSLAALALVLLAGAHPQTSTQPPGDQNSPPPAEGARPARQRATTKLHVVVTAGDDNKPVAAAQVDVNSREEGVSFSATMRTNSSGGADFVVPRGKMLIQVIAQHWNADGVIKTLQGEKETVEIKLQDHKLREGAGPNGG
jgi:hypothetical protein